MSNDDARPRARVAEARRNRATLLEVAARSFASASGPVPLEAIAREAGVGIGTLYRHFPTREALVEAVYESEIDRLRGECARFLAALEPAAALRASMRAFADWAITKHAVSDTLTAIVASGRLEPGTMRAQLVSLIQCFLDAGRAAGDLREDVAAADVAALLAGVLATAGGPEGRPDIERRLDLVVDGLRVRSEDRDPRDRPASR